jgi:hypothetical protein
VTAQKEPKKVVLRITRAVVIERRGQSDVIVLELGLPGTFSEGTLPCRAQFFAEEKTGKGYVLKHFGIQAAILEAAVYGDRELEGMSRVELETHVKRMREENETLRRGLDEAFASMNRKGQTDG